MPGAYSGKGMSVMVSPGLPLGWKFQFMHTLRTSRAGKAALPGALVDAGGIQREGHVCHGVPWLPAGLEVQFMHTLRTSMAGEAALSEALVDAGCI